MVQFKYILCSYLSALRRLACMRSINSNTSYVLIYRKISIGCKPPFFIQIHPMFLFIGRKVLGWLLEGLFKYILCSYLSSDFDTDFITTALFKYILCSYLSIYFAGWWHVFCIQIHPMFLFIADSTTVFVPRSFIQIHPMFLFIASFCTFPQSASGFKYILCSYLSDETETDWNRESAIQIHPMFLFITGWLEDIQNLPRHSNTSYVLIYLWGFFICFL